MRQLLGNNFSSEFAWLRNDNKEKSCSCLPIKFDWLFRTLLKVWQTRNQLFFSRDWQSATIRWDKNPKTTISRHRNHFHAGFTFFSLSYAINEKIPLIKEVFFSLFSRLQRSKNKLFISHISSIEFLEFSFSLASQFDSGACCAFFLVAITISKNNQLHWH